MKCEKGAISALALGLSVMAGCAAVTEQLIPIPNPPSLVGKWTGEWGGNMVHPIELVVERQDGGKLSGTMTFKHHGSSTHRMTGSIGAKPDGSVWALLDVEGRDFP